MTVRFNMKFSVGDVYKKQYEHKEKSYDFVEDTRKRS